MVEYVKKLISEKWKPMEMVAGNYVEGKPQYIKEGLYFSYIFKPLQSKKYDSGLKLHPELLDIYKQCNGMRLFLSGLCIYGFQGIGGLMEPYDIITENFNIHGRMRDNHCDDPKLVFWGSVCNDYVFSYRNNSLGEILCMENGTANIIKRFSSIKDAIYFFGPKLVELYDENYYKIRPNKDFSGIGVLENSAMFIDELFIDSN